jgi:hypothetical protein
MNALTPVERISATLESAGYRRLAVPLVISGLSFDIPAALLGTGRSPDLILVADTAFEVDQRILRKIDGLARALDVVKSKRPLTLVLAGPRPSQEVMEALSKVCRVLPIGTTVNDGTHSALDNWLAVLMPLTVPVPNQLVADPLGAMERERHGLRKSVADLVQIAKKGQKSVQRELHALIDAELNDGK